MPGMLITVNLSLMVQTVNAGNARQQSKTDWIAAPKIGLSVSRGRRGARNSGKAVELTARDHSVHRDPVGRARGTRPTDRGAPSLAR